MKILAVTILCLLFSFGFADESPAGGDISTPCVTCEAVMQYVDSLLKSEDINRDDIENALHSVCPTLKELIDETQCNVFIQQYGDTLLNLLMNDDGSTTTTCVSVGLCGEDAANGIDYQILVPTIDPSNASMTFSVTEKNVHASSVFYYKVFLGGITPDSIDYYTSLTFNFSNYNGVSLKLYVDDPEGIESQFLAECDGCDFGTEFVMWSPANNSWYYLTVNASFQGGLTALASGQYTLEITYAAEQNIVYDGDDGFWDDDDYEHRRHTLKKFLWIPIAVAVPLVCMICCCCCVRRRMRTKYCKSRCSKTQTQEIPMQTPPTPMYFYVPPSAQPPSASVSQIPYFVTRPGQYTYVPMQPGVMPIPMTIPPTAPQSQQ